MARVINIKSAQSPPPPPDRPVTLHDLNAFKADLLAHIRQLLDQDRHPPKRWLKSYQVKQLLGVSHGTLQSMRASGTLPFSRLGGIIYYDEDEINRVLVQRAKMQHSYYPRKKNE